MALAPRGRGAARCHLRWLESDGLHRSPEIGPEESRPAERRSISVLRLSQRRGLPSLALVQRERVFPHECGETHALLRVSLML
jgi:hypothetical protein